MTRPATLLVLGAGVSQVPAIRAAVRLGLRVVTVDWDLRNPGHRYAHGSFEVSTTDLDGVLALARSLSPDGIVTFASDAATGTVAHVAEKLGLPGAAPESVRMLSNKGLIRRMQHSLGLSAPRYALGSSVDELREAWTAMRGPAIVKPVDSSGSRGVSLVVEGDGPLFESAVTTAMSFSRTRQVCVEDFLPGEEVGGDAVVIGGALAYMQCTKKLRRGFIVTGHALPPAVTEEQQSQVARAVERLCRAAGYGDGVVNFDAMVEEDRVTVIELSPRTGGNGIPALLATVTGVSTVGAAIAFALEGQPALQRAEIRAERAGSVVFGARSSKQYGRSRGDAQIRDAMPEIVEYVCEIPESGDVPAWDHGGNSLGYCVFSCPAGTSYEEMAEKARRAVGLEGAFA